MSWNRNAGTKVDDSLPQSWPGTDPKPGAGVAGKVAGYVTRESKEKGERPYSICELAGAVGFTPDGPDSESGELRRFENGKGGVIVGAWLERLLSPQVAPAGTFVQVVYTGMQGRAKTYEVRMISRDDLASMWATALDFDAAAIQVGTPAPAPARSASTGKAKAANDLPF